jgi:hypothetical protein
MSKLPTDGVPALSTSTNNFQELKSRMLTHAASEGLTHLLIDGQDVFTRGIPIKPIKDETTQQMVMPPGNELTRRLERNAVILQNNSLFLIMSRSLMFSLHHLLQTEEAVLAEERLQQYLQALKPYSLWFIGHSARVYRNDNSYLFIQQHASYTLLYLQNVPQRALSLHNKMLRSCSPDSSSPSVPCIYRLCSLYSVLITRRSEYFGLKYT